MFRVYHIIGILLIILITSNCSTLTKLIETGERIDKIVEATPKYQKVDKTHYLNQWGLGSRQEFYHISQGTSVMPYDWFVSLEQPTSLFSEQPLLIKPEYLGSIGFILDTSGKSPDNLPIGFAKDEGFIDSITG
jgi:hypothetical protein